MKLRPPKQQPDDENVPSGTLAHQADLERATAAKDWPAAIAASQALLRVATAKDRAGIRVQLATFLTYDALHRKARSTKLRDPAGIGLVSAQSKTSIGSSKTEEDRDGWELVFWAKILFRCEVREGTPLDPPGPGENTSTNPRLKTPCTIRVICKRCGHEECYEYYYPHYERQWMRPEFPTARDFCSHCDRQRGDGPRAYSPIEGTRLEMLYPFSRPPAASATPPGSSPAPTKCFLCGSVFGVAWLDRVFSTRDTKPFVFNLPERMTVVTCTRCAVRLTADRATFLEKRAAEDAKQAKEWEEEAPARAAQARAHEREWRGLLEFAEQEALAAGKIDPANPVTERVLTSIRAAMQELGLKSDPGALQGFLDDRLTL